MRRQTHEAGFPVIPVLMPGCETPPTGFLQLLTWVDLSKAASVVQQPDSLASLRAALCGEAIATSAIRALVCPYRGLEPFQEEDAPFFCGRDNAIRELVAKVQAHAFVAVVGASGSGKSSLVFAGLLPALRKESQTRTWDVVSFRPGKSPLSALAAAFGTAPENAGPAEIDAYLEREAEFYRDSDADILARIVDRRLDAAPERPDRLLIYVDQWEEVYAMAPVVEDKKCLGQHRSDVDKFIGLLVAATSGARSRATVVLTVRADFYNPLMQSPLISALLPQQQVNIPLLASAWSPHPGTTPRGCGTPTPAQRPPSSKAIPTG
jgi:energy-coupling factor transporter ATP-binding protein EcfA2